MSDTTITPETTGEAADLDLLREAPAIYARLREQLGRRIVGQHLVLRDLMVCLLAQGHALMIGVPGLAKTLIVKTLAEAVALDFRRIQFTPDLMPADVTGSEIIEENAHGQRSFRFLPGPVFTQLLLADEINRAPAKTQSALLEAMQERNVTAGGHTRPLPAPFFVLATQNPIEQEGTYPLPEAQLDRFLGCLKLDYPSHADEVAILHATTGAATTTVEKVCDDEQLLALQRAVRLVHLPASVAEYAVRLVRATRPAAPEATPLMRRCGQWGAGPRAAQSLVLAAKALAALDARLNCAAEDVATAAPMVLRHRLILNYRAEAEKLTTDHIIEDLLKQVKR
ncbi:MAG TPA: AAA family ATPase [Opitutaceae bacterium]|nr:AAA family ATPase [Opitutaceae bacterium]